MAPIRDKFTIHSKAVVCQDVDLKGDITIGPNTVVHPKATIFAIAGPIIIGAGCIIEEAAVVVNRRKEVMRVGDGNVFEIGCRVESPSIGNYNTVSTRARVHHTVRISNHCVIGAACLVVPTEDEILDDFAAIYATSDSAASGSNVISSMAVERRTWSGRGKVQEADLRTKHVEYLREMLPKFNRLRRGDSV
ncbi:trimeric LpxA-like protein [Hygrophoropsis aurantiaca]|uniref:Trimeric LpxA-like protein n=1 Tax=Hygrophoropsis aurantiaca TaxID=72124 RepID=A0ACB8A254_9AGAM|nr:trimeric LpxA-like protein [Hygrophoropsis aurantiaca]